MERSEQISLSEVVNKSLQRRYVVKSFGVETFLKQGFLFVVGLYQEAKTRLTSPLKMAYNDTRGGRFLNDLFLDVFGDYPSDKRRPSYVNPNRRTIKFFSFQVSEVIAGLTDDNKKVPEILLDSDERKLLYLHGFLYRGVKTYSETIWLRRKNREKKSPRVRVCGKNKVELLREVQKLLSEFGIATVDRLNGFAVYRISSLKKLIDLNLLSMQQRTRLEGILRTM